MPQEKDLKRLVRERMQTTGERYTTARVAIVGSLEPTVAPSRTARLTELVQLLANKGTRIEAIRELMGGITATELRGIDELPHDTFDALLTGLRDPMSTVRWWCIQLLDHVADERALWAVADLLDDPVARVRRNAVHALGCIPCKPKAGPLPPDLLNRVAQIAASDPSEKVRREAAYALACRVGPGGIEPPTKRL